LPCGRTGLFTDDSLRGDAGRTRSLSAKRGVLVAVRIVLSIVAVLTASGPHHMQQPGWVAISGSFLVASMGLWIAPGVVIYRRFQTVQGNESLS
jgi:hypothetical protein